MFRYLQFTKEKENSITLLNEKEFFYELFLLN